MDYKLTGLLLSEDALSERVREIGARIGRDYAGKELVVIGILKGAVVFLSDLIRAIPDTVDISLDFMAVSSYGDSCASALFSTRRSGGRSGWTSIIEAFPSRTSSWWVMVLTMVENGAICLQFI